MVRFVTDGVKYS